MDRLGRQPQAGADRICQPRPLLELLSKGKDERNRPCPTPTFSMSASFSRIQKANCRRVWVSGCIYGADFRLVGTPSRSLPMVSFPSIRPCHGPRQPADLRRWGSARHRRTTGLLVAMALRGFQPRSPLLPGKYPGSLACHALGPVRHRVQACRPCLAGKHSRKRRSPHLHGGACLSIDCSFFEP